MSSLTTFETTTCVISTTARRTCLPAGREISYNKSVSYYVYMLTNKYNSVLYTGVTNSIPKRIFEHKNKLSKGFTSKYNIGKLVYYQEYKNINEAIAREKQIKDFRRQKKYDLIKSINPNFKYLLV